MFPFWRRLAGPYPLAGVLCPCSVRWGRLLPHVQGLCTHRPADMTRAASLPKVCRPNLPRSFASAVISLLPTSSFGDRAPGLSRSALGTRAPRGGAGGRAGPCGAGPRGGPGGGAGLHVRAVGGHHGYWAGRGSAGSAETRGTPRSEVGVASKGAARKPGSNPDASSTPPCVCDRLSPRLNLTPPSRGPVRGRGMDGCGREWSRLGARRPTAQRAPRAAYSSRAV